jgi:hypothetical protein
LANRTAVFTLPSDLIGFYKSNIEYIEAHAVDADKRRYASKHEAIRHYIDLDRRDGMHPDSLPRNWTHAISAHLELKCILSDTVSISLDTVSQARKVKFTYSQILPVFYDDNWVISSDSAVKYLGIDLAECDVLIATENLTEHGILPWNLISMQSRLESAFIETDIGKILRYSADLGHYIGDAHVPLHTSVNYNGQLTGQEGIHAFWESRLPELFAEDYDLFTGRATYIDDIEEFYWGIVHESHSLVDSVLNTDLELTKTYGADTKYCFDQRGHAIVRTECEAFAKAFDEALTGMVERRLRKTIHAIGSAWYTAWVNAGRPELPKSGYITSESERSELQSLENTFVSGNLTGRPHE